MSKLELNKDSRLKLDNDGNSATKKVCLSEL